MTTDNYRHFSASLRDSTRVALEKSAADDVRSASKQVDVLIREALDARAAKAAEKAA